MVVEESASRACQHTTGAMPQDGDILAPVVGGVGAWGSLLQPELVGLHTSTQSYTGGERRKERIHFTNPFM